MRLVAGETDGPPDRLLDELEAIASDTGATIQAFDARYVASRRHLEVARSCADRAIDRGEGIADDRAVEILLYAAGRRQIDRAMEMGLKADAHPVVVLVDGGDESAAAEALTARLTTVVEPNAILGDRERLATYFDISEAERTTGADLEALVIERVVLLTIDK